MRKKTNKTSRTKKGRALFDDVVKLTGLPSKAMRRELNCLLERTNIDVKHLTLDQLRIVAASYLKEIMGGLLEPDREATQPGPKRNTH